MSFDRDDKAILDALDFPVDMLERLGPQEFADGFSQSPYSGGVLDTTTLRGAVDPLRNFIVVAPSTGPSCRGLVKMQEGMLVVVANPSLERVTAIKIIDTATRHGFGTAVLALLNRSGPGPFTVLLKEVVEFGRDQVFMEQMDPRDVAKFALCNFVGTDYPGLATQRNQMSPAQKAEFTLLADVVVALGG